MPEPLPLPTIPEAASPFAAEAFVPDDALAAWVRDTLIAEGAPLLNRDHAHLDAADLAFLWTQSPCRVRGKVVVGRAHLGEPQGSDDWLKGLKRDHLTRLFGRVPDFYIVLSTGFAMDRLREGDEGAVLALIEHELYHCAQDHVPGFPGIPRFTADGRPKWRMRPHDVEQFVGVTRRYGPQGPAERAMAEAAERGPTVARASYAGVCGTCAAAFL
ncbi:MAG TPA: putative metallopeptidase [Anaeromyxobacteraceae bacterium]|nr:putative metallopeptidase [Anaeromyxobacteraceae bacterium]